MQKNIVIAVVGLTGCGKTDATEKFLARGFTRVGFNDPLYEELEKRGLPKIQEHERPVREELRRDFGMGVMALRALPKVEAAIGRGENVVIESMHSWSEYKLVKEKFGESFKTLAIYAPPTVRYERLSKRRIRPLSHEEAEARDYAEIENNDIAGPIAIANWTLVNIGTRKKFLGEVEKIITSLLEN